MIEGPAVPSMCGTKALVQRNALRRLTCQDPIPLCDRNLVHLP